MYNKIISMRMKYTIKIFLSLLLFSGLIGCNSRNSGKYGKSLKNLDIYLVIGQSNMAGRADIEKQDRDTLENVFLYRGDSIKTWEKAANPMNKYSTIRKDIKLQKLGPSYTFAREMAKVSDNPIGLVVNAKGGSNIKEWKPGTTFYKEAVRRTKAALKFGTLKGIIWHQGESNTSAVDAYMGQITELIDSLRADLGNPGLPFVAGQLSEDKPKRHAFNVMIVTLPSFVSNTAVVSTEGTKTMEGTHFNSVSQRMLGERYAAEMKKLQKK